MTVQKQDLKETTTKASGSSEGELRQTLTAFTEAIRAGNLDEIVTYYADDIVAYDMMPPLKFTNLEDYKEIAWKKCFIDAFKFPIKYDYKEDQLIVSGDTAIRYGEVHMIGTFIENGEKTECRLRSTSVLQKTDGDWKLVHEHNSVPIDFDGKPLMNLKPGAEH